MGSLEPGKDADFVVWSGDPLSYFSRAERTFVDGRELFSLERYEAMRDRDRAEKQRIIQKIIAKKSKGKGKKKDAENAEATADATESADTPTPQEDAAFERLLDLLRHGGDPTTHRCADTGAGR